MIKMDLVNILTKWNRIFYGGFYKEFSFDGLQACALPRMFTDNEFDRVTYTRFLIKVSNHLIGLTCLTY